MIFEAIEFAAKAHHGQYRKATKTPYITHPLHVANILLELGCDEVVASAGVLHDTVEDTSVTLADIRQHFGDQVAELVEAVSEPDKTDTWENRKQHTVDWLKTAPRSVLLIACADKLDNVRSLGRDLTKQGGVLWTRFNRPKAQQQWYYESLAAVFVSRIEDAPTKLLFELFQAEVEKVFQ